MDVLNRLAAIVGPTNLLTADSDLEHYVTEERGLYRGEALAVARPADTEQVAAVVAACVQAGVAMVPQGGNTGLCGGGVPNQGAVVVSTERLNRIRAVDPLNFTLVAEAGCVLAAVQQAADQAGCLFPLSLGAEGSCRIGGNLSTNAGGVGVLRYGNTRDLALGLEVVLADGRVWNGLRSLRKDNTGYDLKHLFIGAEGTLGIITAASLKLFPKPREIATAFIALPDPAAGLAILGAARRASGDLVTACELVPRIGLDLGLAHVAGLRDPLDAPYPWYLLLELSSSRPSGLLPALEAILAQALEDGHALDAVLAQSGDQRKALWRIREGVPEAQKKEGGSIKHDVAVPVSRVPEMIETCTRAVEAAMPGVRVVAFGHMGDGNIHFNLTQPVGADKASFLDRWAEMNRIVHDIVAEMAGSVSAEHGIGQLKIAEMARYKQDVELDLMRAVKAALDPTGLMNPGKVLPPA
ncbi:FAD-binding oxidoreductase [Magnetospirillum gryphiswaldense]|uniref:FAD-binding oxidoreductase n=1 Tax=Magnetospirillum gryphiswaldense TaxID=55518 RepID=UPI000D034040|nr:FAD-binding oxidoreductase [Magnetospirillum gryphiswaldense]AVM74905.1 putative FAD-linked oxidoreductase [Magnetospirillum gryphiswaldense MSR-1]AVM78808.1 putative FAD-linked oxidoreductase [Magnetospirillum gryphiswaldense]